MRIKKPLEITESRLLASDIPEPDLTQGEELWVSGQAYVAGDTVIRTETHRTYVARQDVTSTTPPENDPINWADVGATNRYKMFDYFNNQPSVFDASGGATITLQPNSRVSSISVFGVEADHLTVTQRNGVGGNILAQYEYDLLTRFTTTWYEYLTGEFIFRNTVVVMNLNPLTTSVFELTFTRQNGLASVETVTIGNPIFIGGLEYGATSDILDFSRIERDEFGGATLVPRKNVPTLGGSIFVEKSNIPRIVKFRKDNQATPLVFLGIDDVDDPYFDSVSGLGIIKAMPIIVEYPNHSIVNLEVEGL